MTQRERLHGSLTTVEYFTFGFGTMIGVGWLVLMDDWLTRGGPLGGILGYLFNMVLLMAERRVLAWHRASRKAAQ